MQKKYDVIVIGAGLAGSFLAYLLKRKNNNVLLIEKQAIETKSKLCGGLLTKKAVKILHENFKDEKLKEILNENIDSVKVFSKVEIIVEKTELATVKREDLDNYILNEYLKLDGELIDGTVVSSINFDNNCLTVDDDTIEYRYLIGADGIFSYVRMCAEGRFQKMNFALETFVKDKSSFLKIVFEDGFKGYNWIIPSNKHTAIGTGNVEGNKNIKSVYEKHISGIEGIDPMRGAFLPTGGDIKLNHKENVILIGDAAGLISPITGEGIYYALESAIIAEKAINSDQDYKENTKTMLREIKKHMVIKNIIFNDKIRNCVFELAAKNKVILNIVSKLVKKYLLN